MKESLRLKKSDRCAGVHAPGGRLGRGSSVVPVAAEEEGRCSDSKNQETHRQQGLGIGP